MKTLTLLAAATAALVAASPAMARTGDLRGPANRGGWPGAQPDCPLTVAFSSFGAGIDQPTLARVERRLRADRRVRSVSRHPWGREGEITLCVRPRPQNQVHTLAAEIRRMIPREPRGPVDVRVNRRPSIQH